MNLSHVDLTGNDLSKNQELDKAQFSTQGDLLGTFAVGMSLGVDIPQLVKEAGFDVSGIDKLGTIELFNIEKTFDPTVKNLWKFTWPNGEPPKPDTPEEPKEAGDPTVQSTASPEGGVGDITTVEQAKVFMKQYPYCEVKDSYNDIIYDVSCSSIPGKHAVSLAQALSLLYPELNRLEFYQLVSFGSDANDNGERFFGALKLPKLSSLAFENSDIANLPDMPFIPNLTSLRIYWCDKLQAVSDSPGTPRLAAIEIQRAPALEKIGDLHADWLDPVCVKLAAENKEPLDDCYISASLYISGTPSLKSIPDFSHMPGLSELGIDDGFGTNGLTSIPNFSHVPKLQRLSVKSSQIQTIPDFVGLSELTFLDLSYNSKLSSLPARISTSKIGWLNLSDCGLTSIPDLQWLPRLTNLILSSNPLTSLPDFSNLPALKTLDLSRTTLAAVPDFSHLENLVSLDLRDIESLEGVPNFSNLEHLESLDISADYLAFEGRGALTTLPDFDKLPRLRELDLRGRHFETCPVFTHFKEGVVNLYEDSCGAEED